MNWKRVLAIGAHPDDIEYGCFGFLASLPRSTELYTFVSSMGSAGDLTSGKARVLESKKAFSLLKIKDSYFSQEKGISSTRYAELSDQLHKYINQIQPDLILTHSPHDTHQEHRLVYEITMTAARRSKSSILRYGILSNTLDFKPSMFMNISKKYSLKKKALSYHRSQKDKYYMSKKFLDIFHQKQYPSLHGIEFCEAFEVERLFQ